MPDIAHTTEPNSDQLTVEHFISGPKTITATRVDVEPKSAKADQPVSIYFDGCDGNPYKPGLSMRRIIYSIWGAESSAYVGRSMTLYVDPTVAFKGKIIGGIRISHMSHITDPVTVMLRINSAQKAPWTVEPLVVETDRQDAKAPEIEPLTSDELNVLFLLARSTAKGGTETYRNWFVGLTTPEKKALQNTQEPDRADFDKMKSVHDACKDVAEKADQ